MTVTELKRKITQAVGKGQLPEEFWDMVKDKVEACLDCYNDENAGETEREADYDSLLKAANGAAKIADGVRRQLGLTNTWRGGRPSSQSSQRFIQYLPKDKVSAKNEHERMLAWEGFLKAYITREPDFAQFRKSLGPTLLNREQTWGFLTSPASRYFGFGELAKQGIAPMSSICEIIDEHYILNSEGKPCISVTLAIDGQKKISAEHNLEDIVVMLNGRVPGEDYIALPFKEPYYEDTYLAPGMGEGHFQPIKGFANTITGDALRICRRVSIEYSMSAMEALIFLLTGETDLRPVEISQESFPILAGSASIPAYHTDGGNRTGYWATKSFVFTVAPWVSARNLAEHYRKFQQQLLGKNNRPPDEHNLELFNFVNEQWDEEEANDKTKDETWRKLFSRWRDKHADKWETMPNKRPGKKPSKTLEPRTFTEKDFQRTYASMLKLVLCLTGGRPRCRDCGYCPSQPITRKTPCPRCAAGESY